MRGVRGLIKSRTLSFKSVHLGQAELFIFVTKIRFNCKITEQLQRQWLYYVIPCDPITSMSESRCSVIKLAFEISKFCETTYYLTRSFFFFCIFK